MSESLAFFLDRCIDMEPLATSLVAAGATVERHSAWFRGDEADSAWLPIVGAKRWIVLTKDRRILTRIPEVAALLAADTHVFVLRTGAKPLSCDGVAAAFVLALTPMQKLIRHRQPPIVATINSAGAIGKIYDYDVLRDKLAP
ncbi:MAG: hypothetical protein ACRCT8_13660 [Lacipirellulaceae bacterium]